MPKVSEDVIKKIRAQGMAKSLKEANSPGASAEFKEGVRRFYPKAVYGPKTKAAAESSPTPTSSSPPSPSPVAKSSSRVASHVKSLSEGSINRRMAKSVSPSVHGVNQKYVDEKSKKGGRGVNQSKSVLSALSGPANFAAKHKNVALKVADAPRKGVSSAVKSLIGSGKNERVSAIQKRLDENKKKKK